MQGYRQEILQRLQAQSRLRNLRRIGKHRIGGLSRLLRHRSQQQKRPRYTCKGCKVLSRLVADGINNAQGICADFQKNPTGTILRSLVYIAVIAITARPVWNAAFVDYNLVVCDWYFIPGLFLLLMFSLIMKQSAGFFKGSSKQIIATYKRTGFSGGRHKVVRYNVHVNFP